MGILYSTAVDAYNQACKVYDEAILANEMWERTVDSVAVEDTDVYQQTRVIQNTFMQSVNAAWSAKYTAEKFIEGMQQCISL